MLTRRTLLKQSALQTLSYSFLSRVGLAQLAAGDSLPAWREGALEIHHISTQRGVCAFLILPDGTTMMVDAGAIYGKTPYLSDLRPSEARRPGEWLGRYVKRRLDAAGLTTIDTFMATHLHGDHIGYVSKECPRSADGTYQLTGIADVAAIVPIARYVDRAWPDYSYPMPQEADFQKNYRALLQSEKARGKKVERFQVGSNRQFVLEKKPATFKNFEVRNLAANGEVWTGQRDGHRALFPSVQGMAAEDLPSENSLSCAIALRYGAFRYFTGGDLTNDTNFGRDPWRDSESAAAEACGPVSVAVADHHGYFNANGERFVRALKPKAFIIQGWDSAHPTVNVLNTLMSKAIYPGKRDVFATMVKEENRIANKRTDLLAAREGHIVVRVDPGGGTFRIYALRNTDESDHVLASFGPYEA